MKMKSFFLALASFVLLASAAQAQSWGTPYPATPRQKGNLHPNTNPNGPGVYSEGGVSVNVPPNCHVSREQVLVAGKLVWRPLVMCPYRDVW